MSLVLSILGYIGLVAFAIFYFGAAITLVLMAVPFTIILVVCLVVYCIIATAFGKIRGETN